MALDVTLTVPDSKVTGFSVHRYAYTDVLNEVFELTLDVTNTEPDIDFRALVGLPITVDLNDEPFVKRLTGIVRRIRQLTAEPTGISKYEIVVVSAVWLTTRGTDHRIFQNQTVDEICRSIVAEYNGRIDEPFVSPDPRRPKREYCVQYGETDFDFMMRVLAEDGMAACFDHPARSQWMLLGQVNLLQNDLPAPIPFIPPSGSALPAPVPHVSSIATTSDVETASVVVRGYDFQNPRFSLQTQSTTTATKQPAFDVEADLEHYEFAVGRFTTKTVQDQGRLVPDGILEERRAERRVLECRTNFALAAGAHFTVENHPRSDVNERLLVVRAQCTVSESPSGAGKIAEHLLTCTPSSAAWRPPRRPKPRIFGTQTAFVVGEQENPDEIEVDELGRVKLYFPWDRRDRRVGSPTRHVRVSHGWAGASFGMMLLPRATEEVIVAYLDGDPDEPIIVGRVFNALNPSPLKLPEEKTRSIWKSRSTPGGNGFNLIMMEDAAGRELLEFRAQKDKLVNVLASHTENVGGDQSTSVGGDQSNTVDGDVTWCTGDVIWDTDDHRWKTGDVTWDSHDINWMTGNITWDSHDIKWMTGNLNWDTDDMTWDAGHLIWTTGDVRWSAGIVQLNTAGATWSAGGHMQFNAPKIVMNTPSFKVTNPSWLGVYSVKADLIGFKMAFHGGEAKGVGLETKAFHTSVNSGAQKVDLTGLKIDVFAFKQASKGTDINQIGTMSTLAAFKQIIAGLTSVG